MASHEIFSVIFLVAITGFLLFNIYLGRKKSPKIRMGWSLPNYNRKSIIKPWGGEEIWAQTDRYVGKILNIQAGHQLSKQYHKIKDETVMVLSGRMEMEIIKEGNLMMMVMMEGDSLHIPPGMIHRMMAITDVKVVEVSTTELDDVVRLEDNYGRT